MPTTPVPGRKVRGSSTGRPLMAALDLLGRRWSLRILWELRDGSLGARALRTRCDDMSSSVLYDRLGELVDAGLVVQDPGAEYGLTPLGRELGRAIGPLDRWATRWSAALTSRRGEAKKSQSGKKRGR
jgi:DNA-binding HxlR family transcriptional regulator